MDQVERGERTKTQETPGIDLSTSNTSILSNPREIAKLPLLSLNERKQEPLHVASPVSVVGRLSGDLPARPAREAETKRVYPFYRAQSAALRQFDESRAAYQASESMPAPVSMPSIGKIIEKPDYSKVKIVLALVGLPARGKSSLAKKLLRYLTWLEYKVKIFNVGELRRKKALEEKARQGIHGTTKSSSFDRTHVETLHPAEKLAEESLENLISWMKSGGNIGIHDARNTNRARRARIAARISQEPDFKLVFLETICEDPAIIEANITLKTSVDDPDYSGLSHEEAVEDYTQGIRQCEAVYETMEPFEWEGMPEENDGISPEALEETRLRLLDAAAQNPGKNNPKLALVTAEMAKNVSYMKITDVGKQLEMFRMDGDLLCRIAYFLMNLHLEPRSIFLSRHGECLYNVENRIGGDVGLSQIGEEYARVLPSVIYNAVEDRPMTVWTSALRRTIHTARHLPYRKMAWKALDEIDAGVCDGMTYKEIEEAFPGDFAQRDRDKFNYRYSGGESYRDVVARLEPVILQLEREKNILVIGHQAILRCLYAYFHGSFAQDELPYIPIPLHTIIKLTPTAYGCEEERYTAPIEASSTHRPKPTFEEDSS